MSLVIRHEQPDSYETLKIAVYGGELFLLPASPSSLWLVESVKQALLELFHPVSDLRKIHEEYPAETIYRNMICLRKKISDPEYSKTFIAAITQPFGLPPEQTAFDPLRLRWNAPTEVFDEDAVYSALHRDTWYANPQCQINWWIPLFEVSKEQAFSFFPTYFNQPTPNTSHHFDYERWSTEIGFQSDKNTAAENYPTTTTRPPESARSGFSCGAGNILLFSGAHLHRTAHNTSDLTRFSIDFRTVDLEDKLHGHGPPNMDNAAKGDASVDYSSLD